MSPEVVRVQVVARDFPPYREVPGLTDRVFVHTIEPDETPKTHRVRGVIDTPAIANARYVILSRFPGARRVPSSHRMFDDESIVAAWRLRDGTIVKAVKAPVGWNAV